MPSIVVHLHLHQPPREDPWLGDVARDPDAAPDHDLTARVERECYRALPAARVNDADGRVRRLVDTLARASFDVAPSLLAWLARERPSTYAAVLAADRAAQRRTGHGAALAHPYHHTILPLLSRRDKVTEVRWGLAEFRRRFGRDAAGMWLPETAADDETLDVLAAAGVRFTVLAPHQLRPAAGGALPPAGRPGRVTTASGGELAVFAYDEGIAHEVAFGGLIRDGRAWAARVRAAADAAGVAARPAAGPTVADGTADGPTAAAAGAPGPALVAVASNAETYGYHHRFGDMALAAMFDALAGGGAVRVENFAAFHARHPAEHAVELAGPSSWSCPHGVERWRADCGCRADPSTHQRWRAPLRAALQALRDALAERFAREGGDLFAHVPGGADAVRDAYNDALPAARGPGDALATAGGAVPSARDAVWARELLEMEREALAMFDSDAWFGDDVDDRPARLALAHAARAAALAGPGAYTLDRRLREMLDAAPSNDPAVGTARTVFARHARAAAPTAQRVAAGVAAARAVGVAGAAAEGGAIPAAWSVDLVRDDGDDPDDADDISLPPAPQAGSSTSLHVTVADRRLGHPTTFSVVVDIPAPPAMAPAPGAGGARGAGAARGGARAARLADVDPRGITVLVRPVDGGPGAALAAALKLADLPERARERVERALRHAVIRRLLGDAEREQLASGAATLDVLAGAALVRAVDALERDLSAPAVARVLGLADLADAAGGGTPVDAQAAIYRLASRLPAAERARLAPVAYRLGFSARGWAELGADEGEGGGAVTLGAGRAEPVPV
jgi:hypothetical protein